MSRSDVSAFSSHKSLSLRTLVTVPFVLLVLGSAVLMGWLGLTGGREAVLDVTAQLRGEVLSRVHQALDDYLSVPVDVNAFNARAFDRGLLNVDDPVGTQRFFSSIVQANPSIAYSYYGNIDGEFFGARRLSSGELQIVRTGRQTGGDSHYFSVTDKGEAGALRQVFPNYDPRTRPWYKIAVEAHGPAWTGVYRHFVLGVPTLTASCPVYAADGHLAGVFGVDYPLTRLHDFLRTIRIGHHGEVYLLERSGALLAASSVGSDSIMRAKEGGGYDLIPAATSGLPMLEAGVGYLAGLSGGLAAVDAPVQAQVRRGEQSYYVMAEPFVDGHGIDWLVLAVAPVSDFMGRIEARARESAVVGLAGLGVAIWAGMFMSRRITAPVERLADAADAISRGHWDHVLPDPYGRELRRLATTFGRMAEQLRLAFDNLTRQHAIIAEHNRTLETRVAERTEELSHMHRQLRAIFDAIPGYVHVVGRDMRVVDAGDKLLRAMGLTREEALGRPCYEVFRGLGAACRECHLNGDVPLTKVEARPSTPEEEALMGMSFLAYSAPIQGETGDVWGYIECLMDVSLLRETERKLEAAKEAAEEANRVKSDFLAKMSHDFRTPLNSIIGLTDITLQSRISPELEENLGTVLEAARSLLELVNDLLDLSQAEAKGLTLREEHFSLSRLLASVVRAFAAAARDKGLRLRLHPAGEGPTVVYGDPVRLRQILTNLVGNAVKFTEQGGVTIAVSPAEVPQGQGDQTVEAVWLRFTVSDTGPGIAPQSQRDIFEPFRQANREVGVKYGGTGLGLAICRQMAELMGGRIELTSEPGMGSTFSVLVPLRQGDPAQVAPVAAKAAGRSLEALRRGQRPMHLLLAEDNPMNVMLARALLTRLGHDLAVAGSGREALALLARERFDAVLMDVEMPGMDGLEATRRIRAGEAGEANRGIAVVAMTAHALSAVKDRCAEAGFDAFVAKPVDFGQLADVLRAVADRSGLTPQPVQDPIRRGAAVARLNDDMELYEMLCQTFLEESPRYRERLEAAFRDGNYAALAQAAHSIKNGCGVIGADSCLLLAQELSTLVDAGDAGHIAGKVADLDRELALVIATLAA